MRQALLRYISIILVVIASSRCCCERWRDTDALVARLHCDMTAADVTKLARDMKADVSKPDASNLPHLVIEREGTQIGCWFRNDHLTAVQVTWIDKPSHLNVEPRRDLCVR